MLQDPKPGAEVSLREITIDNVRAVCDLKLAPGQEPYVAPSAFTIAEANYEPDGLLWAVYADETPVGVAFVDVQPEVSSFKLVRLMIAAEHQRQGFGYGAIRLLAEHLRTLPGAVELRTSYQSGPFEPRGFYERLGFVATGEIEDGENVMSLPLSSEPR